MDGSDGAVNNWVLDCDIRGFFDAIDHGWLMKFIEHRVGDRRVLRLMGKWLRAEIPKRGSGQTVVGTPQGWCIDPLLANVYLHYVLDLWVTHWRKHRAQGDVYPAVRYADDFARVSNIGWRLSDAYRSLRSELGSSA